MAVYSVWDAYEFACIQGSGAISAYFVKLKVPERKIEKAYCRHLLFVLLLAIILSNNWPNKEEMEFE